MIISAKHDIYANGDPTKRLLFEKGVEYEIRSLSGEKFETSRSFLFVGMSRTGSKSWILKNFYLNNYNPYI